MTNKPRRAVIYARYSSKMQSPTSVEDQITMARAVADRNGWQVIDEYADRELTGYTDNRPQYRKMLAEFESGNFDLVISESLDRLARDAEDLARLRKLTAFHDVEVYRVNNGFAKAVDYGVSSLVSTIERENLSHRVNRRHHGLVLGGKSAGGLSYGYRVALDAEGARVKGELTIHEVEAAVVQRIFREYADGISPLKIAAALNAEGIAAPGRGKRGSGYWKQNTINGNRERGTGILNNELYVGRRVWNRLEYRHHPDTDKRVSRPRPEKDWVIVEAPELRIIDDELWAEVKARQGSVQKVRKAHPATDRNGLSSSRYTRRRRYLLSGLIVCGRCNGSMTIAGKDGRRRYYCANHKEKGEAVCVGMPGVSQNDLEPLILRAYQRDMMTDAAFAVFRKRFLAHLAKEKAKLHGEADRLDAEIAEAKGKRDQLIENMTGRRISDAVFAMLEEIEARLERLKEQRVAAEPPAVELPRNLPDLFRAKVRELAKTLGHEDAVGPAGDDLRAMIERLIIRYDDATGRHSVEVIGDLAAILGAAVSENAASYETASCSLSLVAGAGFEPAAFRL